MGNTASLTICASTGAVLTETQEGITMPADYRFATVNDYIHGPDVTYENLEALCLGMAVYIEKLRLAMKAHNAEVTGA